jgi:hypothetical protein
MKRKIVMVSFAIVIAIGLGGMYFLDTGNKTETKTSVATTVSPQEESNALDEAPVVGSSTAPTTESLLLYLIEEEKLAHDVYTKLYEIYGARVFGNIIKSESTHQSKVLALLDQRNIKDPRSSEIGVFTNVELQNLYNQLMIQGMISETGAYKVGVIIEEKDIADISIQLATASDIDVIATLEDLRRGSENHLRAFSGQV